MRAADRKIAAKHGQTRTNTDRHGHALLEPALPPSRRWRYGVTRARSRAAEPQRPCAGIETRVVPRCVFLRGRRVGWVVIADAVANAVGLGIMIVSMGALGYLGRLGGLGQTMCLESAKLRLGRNGRLEMRFFVRNSKFSKLSRFSKIPLTYFCFGVSGSSTAAHNVR